MIGSGRKMDTQKGVCASASAAPTLKMTLSKEQKANLAEVLSEPWGRAELLCDGYSITLSVERSDLISYRVITYINGVFAVVWVDAKNEQPEQKFLRKSIRLLVSPAKRKEAEKFLGKRYVKNNEFYNRTITRYFPDWSSGKAALNHLCKVCDSVQVVPKIVETGSAGQQTQSDAVTFDTQG